MFKSIVLLILFAGAAIAQIQAEENDMFLNFSAGISIPDKNFGQDTDKSGAIVFFPIIHEYAKDGITSDFIKFGYKLFGWDDLNLSFGCIGLLNFSINQYTDGKGDSYWKYGGIYAGGYLNFTPGYGINLRLEPLTVGAVLVDFPSIDRSAPLMIYTYDMGNTVSLAYKPSVVLGKMFNETWGINLAASYYYADPVFEDKHGELNIHMTSFNYSMGIEYRF